MYCLSGESHGSGLLGSQANLRLFLALLPVTAAAAVAGAAAVITASAAGGWYALESSKLPLHFVLSAEHSGLSRLRRRLFPAALALHIRPLP